jgi:hypothetical protein
MNSTIPSIAAVGMRLSFSRRCLMSIHTGHPDNYALNAPLDEGREVAGIVRKERTGQRHSASPEKSVENKQKYKLKICMYRLNRRCTWHVRRTQSIPIAMQASIVIVSCPLSIDPSISLCSNLATHSQPRQRYYTAFSHSTERASKMRRQNLWAP